MLLGISTEPAAAVDICRDKLAGDALYADIDLLSLGFFAREQVPGDLPRLLREAGIAVTIHPIELNLVDGMDQSVLAHLDRWVAALDPRWLEQDGATWLHRSAYLGGQILTHPFTTESAERLGAAAVVLSERWGRPFLVENPPIFRKAGDLGFYEFFGQVATRGAARLTFDVGHAIGAQLNTGERVAVPDGGWRGWSAVGSIHLSGQRIFVTGRGPFWLDSHGSEFSPRQLSYARDVLARSEAAHALTLEMEGASRDVILRNIGHAKRLLAGDRALAGDPAL